MYKLVTECQALGVKLAKKFQVLSGLEAIHCNSVQGTAHEMLTMGCSAWEATYLAITWVPDDECEATTCRLHSEADVAWKEMHEVMYNNQLQYDRQLATFLVDAEKALNDMCGKVWDVICALAESESVLYNACLGLTLQVLNLLPQIPIDILFHTQIPLTIAYCLESSVYRKWYPEQGGVLPLHKEIRVSCILSKVLGGVTCKPSESAGRPPLLLLQTAPWVPVGHRAQGIKLVVVHEAPPLHAADDQALGALQAVTTPFIPKLPKMAMSLAASLLPPKVREVAVEKRTMPKQTRARLRPQAMNRKHLRVKTSRSAHTPRTPSPVLVSSLASMRTSTPSPTLRRRSRLHRKGSAMTAPRRTAPRRTSASHRPQRKSHQLTRHFTMKLGRKCSSLTCTLMLGVVTKLPTRLWAGQCKTP